MRLNKYFCVNLGECICGEKERSLDTLDKISTRLYTLRGHFAMASLVPVTCGLSSLFT